MIRSPFRSSSFAVGAENAGVVIEGASTAPATMKQVANCGLARLVIAIHASRSKGVGNRRGASRRHRGGGAIRGVRYWFVRRGNGRYRTRTSDLLRVEQAL